jgi:hypothetical protein
MEIVPKSTAIAKRTGGNRATVYQVRHLVQTRTGSVVENENFVWYTGDVECFHTAYIIVFT